MSSLTPAQTKADKSKASHASKREDKLSRLKSQLEKIKATEVVEDDKDASSSSSDDEAEGHKSLPTPPKARKPMTLAIKLAEVMRLTDRIQQIDDTELEAFEDSQDERDAKAELDNTRERQAKRVKTGIAISRFAEPEDKADEEDKGERSRPPAQEDYLVIANGTILDLSSRLLTNDRKRRVSEAE